MSKAVEAKLQRANLSLLVASWYPSASAERLKSIVYFVCWMYMIDDAVIDKVSWPGLDNAEAFDAAYHETVSFMWKTLKLDGDDSMNQPTSGIAAIDSFRDIGRILCEKYTIPQREMFWNACKSTMDGYRTEQQLRIAGRIPTWDEYQSYREGSSCMSMCIAMIEYAMELDIPKDTTQSQEAQQLCTDTVLITWLMNDILSARKELEQGFVENAVALCARDSKKAQDGMDRTVGLAKAAILGFERRVTQFEKRFYTIVDKTSGLATVDENEKSGSHQESNRQIEEFVRGCRCIVTGSLSWRFVPISSLRVGITTYMLA